MNITVNRNTDDEDKKMHEFWELQENILTKFGRHEPVNPVVRVRNITQTSLILEWDSLELYTADLRSLDVYKNDTKLAQVIITTAAYMLPSWTHHHHHTRTSLPRPTLLNSLDWMSIMNTSSISSSRQQQAALNRTR